jgi:2-polyprenyl-6-methoxyphenol hydroxylase-like FAD-dependent oxidoreductase
MNAAGSKIIVVGGGPFGITAAHALSRAGIDFVLLESRSKIVIDAGSGLVLSAMGLRALGQLGLLPALSKVSTPVDKLKRLDHKGRDIGDTLFFTYFQQRSVVTYKSPTSLILKLLLAMGLILEYSGAVT